MDGTASVDLLALPLDRFCNYVLTWMRIHLKTDEYMMWRDEIEMPPEGVEAEAGAWSDEEMMRTFQQFRTP